MVAQREIIEIKTLDLHEELRRQRRRLADAWWYERPLAEIEGIEQSIRELIEQIQRTRGLRSPQRNNTTTAGSDAPAQPQCRPGALTARSACIHS
ncbi:MAG TPA: hypothetical protein VGJ91_02460 [Polyangiaceae bacterium]|jgi:hypothetical protein